MSNKALSIIVVLVVIVSGIFLFIGRSAAPTELDNGNIEVVAPEAEETNATSTEEVVKEFVVDASNFSYSPKSITVKQGDRVRLVLKNNMGTHDLKIDEFNVTIPVTAVGKSDSIEFVADKTGSFEYYCSIGTHRAMGMVGSLIVE